MQLLDKSKLTEITEGGLRDIESKNHTTSILTLEG